MGQDKPTAFKGGLIQNGAERKWVGAETAHFYRYICKKSVTVKDFSVRLIVPELAELVVKEALVVEEPEPVIVAVSEVEVDEVPVEVPVVVVPEPELPETTFSISVPLIQDEYLYEDSSSGTLSTMELYTQHKID